MEDTQAFQQVPGDAVSAEPAMVIQLIRNQLSAAMMESAVNAAVLQSALRENVTLRARIAELESEASAGESP